VSNGSSPITAFKKKLYALNPKTPPRSIETQRTRRKRRLEPADPQSLERQVRQLLADKISGNQVGVWLLLPEHLRLGTWDLLCGWSGAAPGALEPRLALQLVHEAALCTCSRRQGRSLSQKGFELANGLPFVASDPAIHELLQAHTVVEAERLQVALGKLRLASGHFQGQRLAIDPHRIKSFTRRQTRRHRQDTRTKAVKVLQTFFCLDAQTAQPIGFLISSAARTVAQATDPLLSLAQRILNIPQGPRPLVLADCEHYDHQVVDQVRQQGAFDLLIPMPQQPGVRRRCAALPPSAFTRHWAGFATAKQPCELTGSTTGPGFQIVQRSGEKPEDYFFKAFYTTGDRAEVPALTRDFPDRWHIEEFFKFNQALGWDRSGSLNLNIRYGQMTLALVAQALLHQLRQRLGMPFAQWDAKHFAEELFGGLEGDVRVHDDTVLVTYYNAPNVEQLRKHYENLPAKLAAEGISPQIPWLYGFKLDFRFR
jgi:hypothetical protein